MSLGFPSTRAVPDCLRIASKFALPVCIAQNHRFRDWPRIVFFGEMRPTTGLREEPEGCHK